MNCTELFYEYYMAEVLLKHINILKGQKGGEVCVYMYEHACKYWT